MIDFVWDIRRRECEFNQKIFIELDSFLIFVTFSDMKKKINKDGNEIFGNSQFASVTE